MVNGRATLAAALGAALIGILLRGGATRYRPAAALATHVRCRLERSAILWSGRFLRSMGAVDSSSRAEQEALLAHKVACALADRLAARAAGISVLVLGGIVHLEGRVGSAEERAAAERMALEASGARVVADDLEIGRAKEPPPQIPTPSRPDETQ